jgi:hypothetical protein
LFTYAELLEKAAYLNHYYFVSLLTFLFVFLPTERAWSVDARRSALPQVVPTLAIWLVRFQVGVVYFFAGLAKLQPDWLFRAEPLSTWLSAYVALPVVGPVLASQATAFVMCWLGAFFDVMAPLGLSTARLRPITYAAVVLFHVTTWLLFPIGMFPWVMIAAATVFFPPHWPRRFVPAQPLPTDAPAPAPAASKWTRRLAWVALPYCLVQLGLPLRHLAYPGDVNWTEHGFRFAWRVMLVEKAGLAEFRLVRPGSRGEPVVTTVHPRQLLSTLQYRQMRTQPDMILQFGQELARREEQGGARGVQVYADAWVSYNGRPAQRLIRPDADLVPETMETTQRWLLPLAPGLGVSTRASAARSRDW